MVEVTVLIRLPFSQIEDVAELEQAIEDACRDNWDVDVVVEVLDWEEV